MFDTLIQAMSTSDLMIAVDDVDVMNLLESQKALPRGAVRYLWFPFQTRVGPKTEPTHVRVLASNAADAETVLEALDESRKCRAAKDKLVKSFSPENPLVQKEVA